jgi:hypothetical protein
MCGARALVAVLFRKETFISVGPTYGFGDVLFDGPASCLRVLRPCDLVGIAIQRYGPARRGGATFKCCKNTGSISAKS